MIDLAVAGGIDLIVEHANQANSINLAWDELWDYIFVDLNGVWLSVIYLSSFVVTYGFIYYALALTVEILSGRWTDAFGNFIWSLVVMALLSNNARPIADITVWIREFTNERVQEVYSLQLNTVTIETAIRDILITSDVKEEISNRFRECEIQTGTEQIECLEEVSQDAQDLIDDAESKFGALAGLTRFGIRFKNYVGSIIASPGSLRNYYTNADQVVVGTIAMPVIRTILKAIQFMILNGIEISFLLTGLYGPIAVAATIFPFGVRAITIWLIGMIALSSLIWSYAVVIGFMASVIAISETQSATDLGFLFLLTFGAPVIAYALSKGGGSALLQAIASTTGSIVRITSSLL